MNIHKNARLTPHSRAELARRVLTLRQSPMSVLSDGEGRDKPPRMLFLATVVAC